MEEYRYEAEKSVITKTGIEFFLQTMSGEHTTVRPHMHSAIEMLFIKKGDFRMFAGENEVYASEGSLVLFRSNTVHRVFSLSDDEALYYVLKVKPSLIMDFSSDERRGEYLLHLALAREGQKLVWSPEETKKNGIADAILKIIDEDSRRDYGFDIAVRAEAAKILLALLRDDKSSSPDHSEPKLTDDAIRRIYDVTVYINKHYGESLTATDCAARAFMSASYFSRCFCSVTGKSFKEYLNAVRINRAERELYLSDRSVTEIAADCGFPNVSYFISLYKKSKGITPKQTRARAKI